MLEAFFHLVQKPCVVTVVSCFVLWYDESYVQAWPQPCHSCNVKREATDTKWKESGQRAFWQRGGF